MSKIIKLENENFSIQLRKTIPSTDWTEASYIAGNNIPIILGSDVGSIFQSKMAKLFNGKIFSENESTHNVSNVHESWVLTLAEKHHSIYARKTDTGILLTIRNAEGVTLATEKINAVTLKRWCEQLQDL